MVALLWLDPGDPFPPTSDALDDPDGLLAAGADLSVATLINAYSHGIFPWYSDGQPILWWSPSPRMVLEPEHFHLSRSLRKALRRTCFEFAVDQDFAGVVRHCATAPREGQPGTWITAAMQQAYVRLHQAGHAHSIEVYDQGELVGGLYGVCLGQAFFGESMFSLRPDASKMALFLLCALHRQFGVALIDCQMQTGHLASLGAAPIERQVFEHRLTTLLQKANAGTWPIGPACLASWRRLYRLEV